jgi:type IV pilus assembly protein PilC
LSSFCAQVALMLGAGMALYNGLETLSESSREDANADLYAGVSVGMIETGSLYEALKRDARWPKYLVEMTAIGERTGHLQEVMTGLSEYYERESRIRQAIIGAITYPLVLGVMLLLIVLLMILRVLPVFQRVLGSLGVAMTASGNLMMRIGANAGWIVLVLVGLVMLAVLACVLLMRTRLRDEMLAFLRRAFPPLRRVTRRLASSRVASVLSMMLSGGFPLEEALEMVPSVLNDRMAAKEIGTVRDKLAGGASFADALCASKLFDPLHSGMIRMGITAGREDQVMEKIAHVYEEQVEDGIANLISVIEPSLVAMLTLVIGAILLSVMLPMAGIISSIL